MLPANILAEVFSSNLLIADRDIVSTRRALLLAPLLAGLPLAVSGMAAQASKLDPSETAITLP
jgi:hypothetical protein